MSGHSEAVGGRGTLLCQPDSTKVEDVDSLDTEAVGQQPRQAGHLELYLLALDHEDDHED